MSSENAILDPHHSTAGSPIHDPAPDPKPRATIEHDRRSWVSGALAVVLASLLALHVLEPDLGITWSYAHLGRHRALVWIALALAVLLPCAGALLWSSPIGRQAPRRPRRGAAIASVLALWLGFAIVGLIAPAPPFSLDSWWFKRAVARDTDVERWFLSVRSLAAAASWLRPNSMPIDHFIIVAHALLAAASFAAIVGACRVLAREVREAWAMALLAASAFGAFQVWLGYVDVYPFAVAGVALFFWAALRALAGEIHPAWAVAIAALGPCFYLGLILLGPPAAALLLFTILAERGIRRAALAIAAATIAAGIATLPLRGWPFDWLQLAHRAWASRAFQAGFLPDSSLLPAWYLWSGQHVGEVANTLILVDPVGCASLAIAGPAVLVRLRWRALDPPSIVLALFVAGFLAYLWVMDATYGAFADWDLFSYGAVGTGLLGGYTLIRFGREMPRRFGAILGLALALAATHLMARLNALDVDGQRHAAESPLHRPPVSPDAPPPAPADASGGRP